MEGCVEDADVVYVWNEVIGVGWKLDILKIWLRSFVGRKEFYTFLYLYIWKNISQGY